MFGQIKHQRNEGTNHRHEICGYTFRPLYIYIYIYIYIILKRNFKWTGGVSWALNTGARARLM